VGAQFIIPKVGQTSRL